MHTSTFSSPKLMLVDENGNQTELNGTIEFEPIVSSSCDELDIYRSTSLVEYSMNIKIDNSTKLTRKKFIKYLMSRGIQRNGANEIAKYILKRNGKYTVYDLLIW